MKMSSDDLSAASNMSNGNVRLFAVLVDAQCVCVCVNISTVCN